MGIVVKTDKGNATISVNALETLVGTIAVESYGVVGMSSRHVIRDGISELLKKENYGRGVVVKDKDGVISIDVYVAIAYGVKLIEVIHSIQSKVEYEVEKMFGIHINSVNVYVQEIRTVD